MKKTALPLLTVVALGLSFAALGCAPPPPPAAPPPAAPPPAPVEVAKVVVLQGLPLSGAQLDVLGDIEFDTNQATIRQTPASLAVLGTLAAAGKAYPQITRLRVEGHTDSDGTEAANLDLSMRRAQAVVRWLADHGIAEKRLNPVGCGSRNPIVPNTSPENKQRNRRTEFDIEEVDNHPFDGATAACTPNEHRKH